MTRTIDLREGRRGGPADGEDVERTLQRARQIFADVAGFLEHEIDALFAVDGDPLDEDRIRAVMELIRQNQQALLKVLDIQARLGRDPSREAATLIDLEAARAEIHSRLDRLAAEV